MWKRLLIFCLSLSLLPLLGCGSETANPEIKRIEKATEAEDEGGGLPWGDYFKSYSWNGTGSIISYSSRNAVGYGLTQDIAKIHPSSDLAPVVFFQWELDQTDGRYLKISAAGMETATISYGPWDTRMWDRSFYQVPLPFVLDPSQDGFPAYDGSWYTIMVAFDKKPSQVLAVEARATREGPGDSRGSYTVAPLIDNTHTWNGNGSIISYSSGYATGYGLTRDVARIHPASFTDPVVFFQWEIDSWDGRKLEISAAGMERATITYGSWGYREQDISHPDVTLPFVLDPVSDGFSGTDGNWMVVKVAFDHYPDAITEVHAKTVR